VDINECLRQDLYSISAEKDMCYNEIKPCVKYVLTVAVNTIGMAYVIIKIENRFFNLITIA